MPNNMKNIHKVYINFLDFVSGIMTIFIHAQYIIYNLFFVMYVDMLKTNTKAVIVY
jgi:hypothetical protein